MSSIFRLIAGSNTLDIVDKKGFDSFYNYSVVMYSSGSREFKQAVPVLGAISTEMIQAGKDTPVHVLVDKRKEGPLEALLDSINRNKEEAEEFALSIKPDEIVDNKPAQRQALKVSSENIEEARKNVLKYANDIKIVTSIADDLLRTELPPKVWGAKDINKTLASIKDSMGVYNKVIDKIDYASENSDINMSFIKNALNVAGTKKKKKMAHEAVSGAENNIQDLIKIGTDIAQTLSGLLELDGIVKKSTGYPATWFFDSSVLYDLKYGYEDLIKGVMKSASIESRVIRPLKKR